MAVIRRHPTLFGMLMLALGVVACGWLLWPQPQQATADPTYQVLDPVAAADIGVLRRELGLDDDVLACLDLSDQSLEALLAGVRGWYEAHTAEWKAQRAALADQRARVRTLQTAVGVGQASAAALTAAKQQLAASETQYASGSAALRQSLIGQLPGAGQALVARMYAGRALAMPYRVLELSEAQRQALQSAQARYHQRLAVARQPESLSAIVSEYVQERATALGTGNLQTLAGLQSYLGPASERVVTVIARVLPVEPSIDE